MLPTQQLGYLIHHISFVLDRQSDQALQERLDIGFSQFKIMMALRWNEGVQQKHIAKALGQTEASISRQIRLMHDKGLVESRVNPRSRREHITVLTSKGLTRAEEAMSVLNQYHAPMFARLNDKQQAQLGELLNAMHAEACRGNKPGRCNLLSLESTGR